MNRQERRAEAARQRKKRDDSKVDERPIGAARPRINVAFLGPRGNGRMIVQDLDVVAAPVPPPEVPIPTTIARTLGDHLAGPRVSDLPETTGDSSSPSPAPIEFRNSKVDPATLLGRGDLTLNRVEVPGVGTFGIAERVTRSDESIVATVGRDDGANSNVAVRVYPRKENDDIHQRATEALVEGLRKHDASEWQIVWIEKDGGSPIPPAYINWDAFADALVRDSAGHVFPVQITVSDASFVGEAQRLGKEGLQRQTEPLKGIERAIEKKGVRKYAPGVLTSAVLVLFGFYPLTEQDRTELAERLQLSRCYKEVWLIPLGQAAVQFTQGQ
jgi:hypothetical protein